MRAESTSDREPNSQHGCMGLGCFISVLFLPKHHSQQPEDISTRILVGGDTDPEIMTPAPNYFFEKKVGFREPCVHHWILQQIYRGAPITTRIMEFHERTYTSSCCVSSQSSWNPVCSNDSMLLRKPTERLEALHLRTSIHKVSVAPAPETASQASGCGKQLYAVKSPSDAHCQFARTVCTPFPTCWLHNSLQPAVDEHMNPLVHAQRSDPQQPN